MNHDLVILLLQVRLGVICGAVGVVGGVGGVGGVGCVGDVGVIRC